MSADGMSTSEPLVQEDAAWWECMLIECAIKETIVGYAAIWLPSKFLKGDQFSSLPGVLTPPEGVDASREVFFCFSRGIKRLTRLVLPLERRTSLAHSVGGIWPGGGGRIGYPPRSPGRVRVPPVG